MKKKKTIIIVHKIRKSLVRIFIVFLFLMLRTPPEQINENRISGEIGTKDAVIFKSKKRLNGQYVECYSRTCCPLHIQMPFRIRTRNNFNKHWCIRTLDQFVMFMYWWAYAIPTAHLFHFCLMRYMFILEETPTPSCTPTTDNRPRDTYLLIIFHFV